MNLTCGRFITTLADDGNFIWVGTYGGGLVNLNKATGEVILYNKCNSGLPYYDVRSIAIDGAGNIWIGTRNGLSVYREGGVKR